MRVSCAEVCFFLAVVIKSTYMTIFRVRKKRKALPYTKQAYLTLVPYGLATLLLVVFPTIATIGVAFTEYNGLRPPVWVGWDNFRELLSLPLVQKSFRASLFFVLTAVPLRVLGALGLALILGKQGRGMGVYRAAVYLPTIIPETAYALIWLWIYNPVYGPLNQLLGGVGLPQPAWLLGERSAQFSIAFMLAFQLGEGFVVLLAGLRSIPRSYYEAATIDGANRWATFRYITLPLLFPWLLLLTFRDILVSLQNTFTPSFILTYGGPYYATTFLPLLVYEVAFDLFLLGTAAALILITYALIVLAVTAILSLFFKRDMLDVETI